MGANDADEVVVGSNGAVYVAPLGSTLPTNLATAMTAVDPDYVTLGFISEDGATFTDEKEITDIGAWQSFYPIRRIVGGRNAMLAFVLRQWDAQTVPLAFGGGTISEPLVDVFKYRPPAPETIDERVAVLEWKDGIRKYRLVMPRCMVTENVETNLVRTGPADLPITLSITSDGTLDAWFLLTDDVSFGEPSNS